MKRKNCVLPKRIGHNRRYTLKAKGKFLLMMLALWSVLGTQATPAFGETSAQVVIHSVNTDAASFPQVTLMVSVLDGHGQPITGIRSSEFEVTENDQQVAIQVEEQEVGLQTSLVLDMGSWINNPFGENQRVRDILKDAALGFVNTMRKADKTEIIAVYGETPVVVVPFTSDKETLQQAIYNLQWDNTQVSYGTNGIAKADEDLSATPTTLYRAVLFISGGIMQRDYPQSHEEATAKHLAGNHIPVFSLYIPWKTKDEPYVYWIQQFPAMTNGMFAKWQSSRTLNDLFAAMGRYRTQYQITYRSSNGKDTSRKVSVGYQGTYGNKTYTVDARWLKPPTVQIVVNNGKAVWRKATSEKDDVHNMPMTSVPVEITLAGLGGRQITEIHFFVNGEERAAPTQTAPGKYTTTWDISNIVTPGQNQETLEVTVKDELGITAQGKQVVSVEVTPPVALNLVCAGVSKIPVIGHKAGDLCVRSGVNLMTVILSAVVLVLGVLLWKKKEAVAAVGHDIGVRATNVVKRFTNRLQSMEPKAKLVAKRGFPEDAVRKEFDIFGETKIGRSREFANLIFENDNISRLHCVLHEDLNGGWSIEDQDSANGTFVNGERLTPFNRVPLSDGDLIELAPVEYGGFEFAFVVLERHDDIFGEGDEEDDLWATTNAASISEILGDDDGAEPDVRKTQRMSAIEDASETSWDIDDPANQRY